MMLSGGTEQFPALADPRIDRNLAARYPYAMSRNRFFSHFAPGDWVRHPDHPEWGLGQVQSALGGRLTATFEHTGKQSINAEVLLLIHAEPTQSDDDE